jgi:hypothetical protein
MVDSVRLNFSASIGALISGVEDAKKAIESVKESTDKVTEGAKGLVEALAAAPVARETGDGGNVRLPLPIAAFRAQGRFSFSAIRPRT